MNTNIKILLTLLTFFVCACTRQEETRIHTLRNPPLIDAKYRKEIIAEENVPPTVLELTKQVWKEVIRTRQLQPLQSVRLSVLSPQELVSVVKKQVDRELPREFIQGEGRTFQALGLLPVDFDYESETYELLREQLLGLYVPDEHGMYLLRNLDLKEIQPILAHELVHALQDQHFNIHKKLKYSPGESDSLTALHALAEGEATSAMIDQSLPKEINLEDPQVRSKLAKRVVEPEEILSQTIVQKPTDRIAKTPKFLALNLLAPYAWGLRFVQQLRLRGGWAAVNAAWASPPISTEQLLHLEKYDAHEPPIHVGVAPAQTLGAEWKKTFDDVVGEAGSQLVFSQWVDATSARRAANGWGGDRITLFENKSNQLAVAWKLVFDSQNEAYEAFKILNIQFLDLRSFKENTTISSAESNEMKWTPLPTSTPAKPNAVHIEGCKLIRRTQQTLVLLFGAACDNIELWAKEVLEAK